MRRSALACAWPCRRSAGDRRAGGGLGSRGGVDSRSRWRRISARVRRWSMGCVRAGCRWGRRRLWVWMRRRGRACTTWRCSGSWAVRRMPRRPLPGGRRRGDVQRRHGTDVDGLAARERALLPAPCGGGSSRAPPSWPCGPSDGRPPDGSAQLVGTLRGSGPPGRPAQHGRCRPGGAGPCLRALGRQGLPGWPRRRGRADRNSCHFRRPGCRAVGAPSTYLSAPTRATGNPRAIAQHTPSLSSCRTWSGTCRTGASREHVVVRALRRRRAAGTASTARCGRVRRPFACHPPGGPAAGQDDR
jgi:hypothetical protein